MISYTDFILKYPQFKNLDPDFKDKIEITTITIVGSFNEPKDINKLIILKDYLSNDFINTIDIQNKSYTIARQKKKYNKGEVKKRKVVNIKHITIKTTIENKTISIKLFKTGKFQITGANNISFILWTFYRLFIFLDEKNILHLNFTDIQKFKVKMINCKCYYPCIIDLYTLYEDLLNDKNLLYVQYDPNKHSGIEVKILKENPINIADDLSIFIFANGNILVSGAKKYNDITYAYRKFYNYLFEHSNCVFKYDEDIQNKDFRKHRELLRIDNDINAISDLINDDNNENDEDIDDEFDDNIDEDIDDENNDD